MQNDCTQQAADCVLIVRTFNLAPLHLECLSDHRLSFSSFFLPPFCAFTKLFTLRSSDALAYDAQDRQRIQLTHLANTGQHHSSRDRVVLPETEHFAARTKRIDTRIPSTSPMSYLPLCSQWTRADFVRTDCDFTLAHAHRGTAAAEAPDRREYRSNKKTETSLVCSSWWIRCVRHNKRSQCVLQGDYVCVCVRGVCGG